MGAKKSTTFKREEKKRSNTLGIIVAIVATVLIMLTLFIASCAIFNIGVLPNTTPTYSYEEAAVVGYTPSKDATFFTVHGDIYSVFGVYEEDAIYLLTMNTKDTKNYEDDEIVVVWKSCTGEIREEIGAG